MNGAGSAGTWVLQRCAGDRFPYRLEITAHNGRSVMALRVQDRWPAANRNLFCLREKEGEQPDVIEEIERIPLVAIDRRGVRWSVVLDRPRYKRCDFLFLSKASKSRPGETYEQIYWQTQRSMAQRRPYVAPISLARKDRFTVRIASDERYPWTFPNSSVERGSLPAGDYALMDAEGVCAVVERKTFDNLLADFGVLPVLHQRVLELSTYQHNALVVEAPYEDFLNPARLHHYSPSFCAAAIAELYARYPNLRIVFCSNRKTASLWTRSFFAAVWRLRLTSR